MTLPRVSSRGRAEPGYLADKLPAVSGALGWRRHGPRQPATAVPGDVNYTSSTLIDRVLLVRPAAVGGKGHPVEPLHPFLSDQGILSLHIADYYS